MKAKILIVTVAVLALFSVGTAAAENTGHFQGNVSVSPLGVFWKTHLAADASFGWRLNNWFYAGVGTGCHYLHDSYRDGSGNIVDNGWSPAIPLYLDMVGYLPFPNKSSALYLGVEAGGMYALSQQYSQQKYYLAAAKTGVDIAVSDRLGVTLGVSFISSLKADFSGLALSLGLRF
ncbi:MAG: hypothetical protein IJS91_01650 [Bacteroidales bacterium]|nr:hypothetical protein [Bacteroidales bacterium]